MKNKTIAFTAFDKTNERFFPMLKNSWDKFHKDIEIKVYREEEIKAFNDPMFFYRQKPLIANKLLEEYETVIGLDVDQIICSDLTHTWTGDFNIGVVQNSNPQEIKKYPVAVWDIPPLAYVNCGYVVMKSKAFVEHWWALCTSYHFNTYQFKEQDLLNILVYYGGYAVNFLDSGDRFHGLAGKGYEPQVILNDKKELILPQAQEWPQSGDKQICIIHFSGGNNNPEKGNYRIKYQEDVVKHLDHLTSDE